MRGGRIAHLSRVNQQQADSQEESQTLYPPQAFQETPHSRLAPNATHQEVTSVPRPLHPSQNSIPHHTRWELKPQGTTFPAADQLFTAESQYDASPQFVRPTSMCITSQPNKWKFPQGGWFMPLGSSQVPSIRVTAPPRCLRCKAYLNAFFKVEPNGTVCCNICSHRYTPQEKLDPTLIANGQLMTQGVVDYKVTDPLYVKKSYDQVKILIALQMTKSTIDNNLFSNIIQSIKASIQAEFEPSVRIGIVLYDQATHFYKVRSLESELTQYSVNDPTGSLCPLADSELFFHVGNQVQRAKFDYLLDRLAQKAQTNTNTNIATNYFSVLSCLNSAFGKHSGRVVLFSVGQPTVGPGKLRPREKQQLKTPLKQQSEEYVNLAKELVKNRIGVDHFIFGRQNMYQHQLATTHFLSTSTGGSLYYYTVYNPLINGDHLHFTIFKTLTKQYAYDVDFTCRVSNGLSVSKFIVADGIREERDVSLGCLDSNQSIGVTFAHQEKLAEVAYVQFAMMFTNGQGERVIRVINYRLQVVEKLELVHQGADYLAVANIISKLTVNHLFKVEPMKVLQECVSSVVEMLVHYKNQRGEVKFSQLQVHPNMKNFLSYLHAVVSSCLFTNLTKLNSDRRIEQIVRVNSLGFRDFANKYYPKLYCVDLNIYNDEIFPGDFLQSDPDVAILPPTLPLANSSIVQDSAYIIQDNDFIYLFVMADAPSQLLSQLFGVNQLSELNIDTGLPQLQAGHNIRVSNIISELRRRNTGLYLPMLVLTPMIKGMYEQRLYNLLKEDNKERGYLFFLKHLHSRVQAGK